MHKIVPLIIALCFSALLQSCASLDVDPTSEWSAQDFYEEAKDALDAGEFKTAIDYLETLEARFPFDPYAKQAQLDVAYSYYKFDEPESATSAADRFLRLHPRDSHIDYVYYLKGLINFDRGRSILDGWFPRDMSKHETATLLNALREFSTLVRKFPDSMYAGDAYQHMVFLQNMLAKQEIDTALFYVERKAWLAAANRAKKTIQRYQDSIWTLTALEIMINSYQQLGLDDLAADTKRILELNKSNNIKSQSNLKIDKSLHMPPIVARSS